MKLRNKLLTVLPITTIGVLTPVAISSCSCGNSYTIKFGDTINCKNKDDKVNIYHSIEDVKNGAKSHVQPPYEGKKLETDFKKFETDKEFFYWDIVYSYAIGNIAFFLDWNGKKINDISFESLSYKWDGDKVGIFNNNGTKLIDSYEYSLCTK